MRAFVELYRALGGGWRPETGAAGKYSEAASAVTAAVARLGLPDTHFYAILG